MYGYWQRLMDIAVALGVLLFLWPVLLALCLWVRLDSPGQALFIQRRLGRHEREFALYKLRTMKTGTQSAGTHEVSVRSVTNAGQFLRRTKLDEVPQAINLLRGELTLVGPRPCLPSQLEVVDERRRRNVFAIKPGITGLAQIREIDMSQPEKLAKCDAEYMASQGLGTDFRILAATLTGRGQGDRVSVAGNKKS